MVVIFLILLVVLIDMRELKRVKLKGRIIGTYSALMALSFIVVTLIYMGRRPVSPAVIIENILRSVGVVK